MRILMVQGDVSELSLECSSQTKLILHNCFRLLLTSCNGMRWHFDRLTGTGFFLFVRCYTPFVDSKGEDEWFSLLLISARISCPVITILLRHLRHLPNNSSRILKQLVGWLNRSNSVPQMFGPLFLFSDCFSHQPTSQQRRQKHPKQKTTKVMLDKINLE